MQEKNYKNTRAVKKTAPAKKNKRKKRKFPRLLKWTSIFILIIAIGIVICTTPMFNVKEIKVTGNSKVSATEIQSLSKIKMNDNIFKYSKKTISESICQNPYIKNVEVKRKYPDTIELIIEERKTVATVKVLNSFAYIDNEGYVLEVSEDRQDLTIIEGIKTSEANIKVGEKLVEEDTKAIAKALKVLEVCNSKITDEKVYSINIQNDEFTIYLANQKKLVYLGDASNLNYRIDLVNKALEKIKEKEGRLYANGDLNSRI